MKRLTKNSPFRLCALAVLMAGLSGSVWAEDRGAPTEQELAAQDKAAAIAAIGAARAGTITDLVNQWSSAAAALGYPAAAWGQDFTTALQGASDAQLYDIQNAASYDGVRAILQGRNAPVSLDGVAVPEALGDNWNDVTYTPVTPCRILDTRVDTDGATQVPAGSTRNYYVFSAGSLAFQGGNALGCPLPAGKPEPSAIAANFAVVPSAAGHIRVFPYSAPLPTASFLNFQAGNNLANAGIVATCYLCGPELSIYNNVTTHYLADVMGYFYPNIGTSVELRHGGYDWATATITNAPPAFNTGGNGNTTLTFVGGEDVLVTVVGVVTAGAAYTGTLYPSYQNTSTLAVTNLSSFENQVDFCYPAGDNTVMASARVSSMPAGTYEFGFYAFKGNDNCGAASGDYAVKSPKISVIKVRH